MSWRTEARPAPFLLRPAGKDYLWGGTRLRDDFSKELAMEPLAETWECSTHPDGPSHVCGGEFDGQSLAEVLKEHPEFLGSHPRTKGELPILIKLIDAKKDLSVQVHPSDEFAAREEHGQLGKTEMWYVLDTAKDAHLVYGLHRDTDAATLRRARAEGSVMKYLQKVPVRRDDVFYIEAGTIHALGAGPLVAEIQETSNLTYRLYDYDRTDKAGNKRPLHIDKALAAADLRGKAAPVQPMRVRRYRPGCAAELLCRCRYFEVNRLRVNTERIRAMVPYRADGLSFRVLLCVAGCGMMKRESGEVLPLFKGDCVFFPANSQPVWLHGRAQFLDVRC